MAWRIGRSSVSRSLMSAARSSPPVPGIRPPSAAAPRLQSRRLSFAAPSRNIGQLGCIQSLLPLHGVMPTAHLTSRLNSNVRAFCELSHGTFCRTCQDR